MHTERSICATGGYCKGIPTAFLLVSTRLKRRDTMQISFQAAGLAEMNEDSWQVQPRFKGVLEPELISADCNQDNVPFSPPPVLCLALLGSTGFCHGSLDAPSTLSHVPDWKSLAPFPERK